MNTIKKFIHYYGPYKAVFFIDLICAAVISLVDLAYPQILRTMTKTLFTQDKNIILHALPVIGISLFVMYIIQSLCKYYVTYQGHMMGAKMERDMRRELFDHYQELSFSYYSRNNSGQMILGLYQQEACTAADPPGDRNVCVFLPPECKNAGNLHGKPS